MFSLFNKLKLLINQHLTISLVVFLLSFFIALFCIVRFEIEKEYYIEILYIAIGVFWFKTSFLSPDLKLTKTQIFILSISALFFFESVFFFADTSNYINVSYNEFLKKFFEFYIPTSIFFSIVAAPVVILLLIAKHKNNKIK